MMDLLRMVIHERKKVGDVLKQVVTSPNAQRKDRRNPALIRIEDVLYRNELIAQRRERLAQALVSFELRLDVLLEEVQRVKEQGA